MLFPHLLPALGEVLQRARFSQSSIGKLLEILTHLSSIGHAAVEIIDAIHADVVPPPAPPAPEPAPEAPEQPAAPVS